MAKKSMLADFGNQLKSRQSWTWFAIGVLFTHFGTLDMIINAIQNTRQPSNP